MTSTFCYSFMLFSVFVSYEIPTGLVKKNSSCFLTSIFLLPCFISFPAQLFWAKSLQYFKHITVKLHIECFYYNARIRIRLNTKLRQTVSNIKEEKIIFITNSCGQYSYCCYCCYYSVYIQCHVCRTIFCTRDNDPRLQ